MKKILPIALLLGLALSMLVFAASKVIPYFSDRKEVLDKKNDLISSAVTERDTTVEPVAPTVQERESGEEEENVEDEPEFREETILNELPPISVDFSVVGHEDAVVGWIYCADSPINYPVAQWTDNWQFEEHDLNGVFCYEGTIYLDYRNNRHFEDFATIVYGHDMYFGHMFGCLDLYKEQEYFDEHPYMYLLTPDKNYKIELMYGFITKKDSFIYDLNYTKEWREQVLETAKEGTTFVSGVEGDIRDHYVLLSTCTYEFDGARYVLVGKLQRIMD